MNNVVLVGRLTSNPEVQNLDDGKQVTTINVAVSRNYKNSDGIYETDFIRCVLWNNMAANTSEYCKSGDVIGIKGRLQSSTYEDENKNMCYVTEVVAERVTFLSSAKNKEELENIDSNQNSKRKKKEN